MILNAQKLATYQDIIDLPEHLVGEITHGILHAHPRPAPKHSRASSMIGIDIGNPFDKGVNGPGGWWILDEPELHLGPDVLVSDLAGWRRERMPKLPDAAFELAPDWVCEVLSPSTARFDRAEKMPLYAQNGVQFCWLVDPELQTLEAYKLVNMQWLLLATLDKDKLVSIEPFDATEFNLSDLWV